MRGTLLLLCAICALPLKSQWGQEQVITETELELPAGPGIADLDNDGLKDVFISSWQGAGKVVWYKNLGVGLWSDPKLIASNFLGARRMLPADIDGDGDMDLAVSSYYASYGLNWFENTGTTPWVRHLLDTSPDLAEGSLDVGDLDGDGDLDLVVYGVAQALGWFSNDGSGGFSSWQFIAPTFTALDKVFIADMDVDGDQDLLVQRDSILWYANDGSENFTIANVLPYRTDYNVELIVADLNADGAPDLVTDCDNQIPAPLADQLGVYINDGAGGLSVQLISNGTAGGSYLIHPTDIDLDGDLDLFVCYAGPSALVYTNMGGGVFQSPTTALPNINVWQSAGMGDLDGDGRDDLVVASDWLLRYTACFHQDSPGVFTQYELSENAVNARSVLLADLNGDDIGDILTRTDGFMAWQEGLGEGEFGREKIIQGSFAGIAGHEIATTDLNGDGDEDIVFTQRYANTGILTNDGAAHFTYQSVPSSYYLSSPEGLRLGDLNGDQITDALWSGSTNTTVLSWSPGNGNGGFDTARVVISGPGLYAATDMELGDVDGDGDLDVVAFMGSSLQILLSLNDGTGVFAAPVVLANTANLLINHVEVELLDVELDGDLDLAYSSSGTSTLHWMENSGSGVFSARTPLPCNNPQRLAVSDLDGDGYAELIYAISNGLLGIFTKGTDSVYTALPNITGYWYAFQHINPEDVDSDGDEDILLAVTMSFGKFSWLENYSPGATTIGGSVFVDINGNGVKDTNDPVAPWLPVHADPPPLQSWTNASGSYTLHVDTGHYEVTLPMPSPYWSLSTDSATYHPSVSSGAPHSVGNDFGLFATAAVSVVEPSLVMGAADCGTNGPLWLELANWGTQVEQGTIALDLGPQLSFVSADPAPDLVLGNLVQWSFDSLDCFEHQAIEVVVLHPSAQSIGDTLSLMMTVQTVDSLGALMASFTDSLSHIVSCSTIANSKSVVPAGYGSCGAVAVTTDHLDYTIHFQNSGADTAHTVTIRDQLPAELDASTLQLLAASHTLTDLRIEPGNEIVFTFQGIDLPSSNVDPLNSRGQVHFRLALLPGLADGTAISNGAFVHFDLNAPLPTNSTLTTLVDCSGATAGITWAAPDMLQASIGDSYQWFLNGNPLAGEDQVSILTLAMGSYTVQVTDSLGCIAVSPPYQVIATSMPESFTAYFAVVPNPAREVFRLVGTSMFPASARIELLDIHGRIIRAWHGNNGKEIQFERGDLPSGAYLLRVVQSGASWPAQRFFLD
jgi:uncharacterized repeat protein (TIGR01451 family)